jgi:stage II sporulation protein D
MPHPDQRRPARRRSVGPALALVAVVVAVLTGLPLAPVAVTDARTPPDRSDPVATLEPTTPPASEWPTATGPTTLGSTVRLHGRGYGHGVGLNQYGARGRALDGQQAEHILAHYYLDTELGSVPLDTPIRVRLYAALAASSSKPLVLVGRGDAWTIDGVATVFPKDARLEARPLASGGTVSWRVKVISAAGATLRDAAISSFRVRGVSSFTTFEVAAKPDTRDRYRGTIRVGLSSTASTASVTNELNLELYLRGVVPAEMPSTWPVQALEAQAIAARSYAARRLRPGTSYFDVPDDSSSQVYLGIEGEKAATSSAVAATAGVVLKRGSEIANAMFHSTGGGATEANENVYTNASGDIVAGPVSYLRGGPDRRSDGTAYDGAAPYATWATASYTRAALSAIFAGDSRTNVGTLTALDLTDRGVGGRLRSVTLIGSSGTKRVSGDVFRSVFNARRPATDPQLRSTLFDTQPVP